MGNEIHLHKMTWPEIKEGIEKIDAVLIPVGSTEQHGRHLPIEFDYFSATRFCEMAAQTLNQKGKWVVVAPPILYGCSWYHMQFPGTITLSQKTFMEVVKEVCESLAHHGFKNLIIMNSHGGNSAALTTCLNDLYAEKKIRVVLAQWFTLAAGAVKELEIKSPRLHAGEVETSIAMALGTDVRKQELTRACMNRRETHLAKGIPTSKHIAYDSSMPGSGVLIPMDYMKDITDTGVVGDACAATMEKGKRLVEVVNALFAELIEELGRK